ESAHARPFVREFEVRGVDASANVFGEHLVQTARLFRRHGASVELFEPLRQLLASNGTKRGQEEKDGKQTIHGNTSFGPSEVLLSARVQQEKRRGASFSGEVPVPSS